jgi:transposase
MSDSPTIASLSQEILDLKSLVSSLLSRVSILEAENAALRAENIALRAENADLRSRLGLNSNNSHKPPSTDGLAKKTATGLPKEKGKKQGGQEGHEGYTLKMVATPDKIEIHHPTHCSCCHRIFDVSEVSATLLSSGERRVSSPEK